VPDGKANPIHGSQLCEALNTMWDEGQGEATPSLAARFVPHIAPDGTVLSGQEALEILREMLYCHIASRAQQIPSVHGIARNLTPGHRRQIILSETGEDQGPSLPRVLHDLTIIVD
jgi:hypothetical protein